LVELGKRVFAGMLTMFDPPATGCSKPQSPTRLRATVAQFGCVVAGAAANALAGWLGVAGGLAAEVRVAVGVGVRAGVGLSDGVAAVGATVCAAAIPVVMIARLRASPAESQVSRRCHRMMYPKV
jgi:hypothetical protein